jgi:glycine/D-amino acid oxidase-like deaminating enzyme
MSEPEVVDAIVIGANMRGLVSAYALGALGQRTVVLERAKSPGGADSSFQTSSGATFDFGLHVLDENRSPAATRLFQHVTRGAVRRTLLRRGLVLRGRAMPYAPTRAQMPPDVAALLREEPFDDDLGNALPTRPRLGAIYGDAFAAFVFDEVLPSFPSENRHRAFGVDEALLLANIYPWFFPRAPRRAKEGDESRAFHDKLRAGIAQHVLYPERGGFGGFARAFVDALDPRTVELVTGAHDLQVTVEPGAHRVVEVTALGRRFQARHHFWAAGWSGLCALLGLPCQDTATDRVMLGSFVLADPPRSQYDELLVGDPSLWLNRVYFPGHFRAAGEPLVQVEFAVPIAESWPTDAAVYRERWETDLRRLGVIAGPVREFDFKSLPMHFNGYGMEGVALVDADPTLLSPDANVHPVVPSLANLNLNRYVPRVLAQVTDIVTRAEDAP